MGNRAKPLFCSVLFNKFHQRTKLMALLFSNFVFNFVFNYFVLEITKLWVLRVPSIQIPTQNEKMKILFSKFYPRINLTELLSSILVPINKTKYSEFLRFPPCNFSRDFVKERFSWPKNGFIVFRSNDLVEKSVVRFILGWNFLNKTSNPNFALGV
jgi:hypothetical protein